MSIISQEEITHRLTIKYNSILELMDVEQNPIELEKLEYRLIDIELELGELDDASIKD